MEEEEDDEEDDDEEDDPPTPENTRRAPAPQVDLLDTSESAQTDLLDGQPNSSPPAASDLLSLDAEEPAEPTDFSKPLEFTSLPDASFYDSTRCEKPPLPASVAAGIAVPRGEERRTDAVLDPLALMGTAPATPATMDPMQASAAGLTPEVLAAVQALAAQSQVSPQQLLQAAQGFSQVPAAAASVAPALSSGTGGYPAAQGSVGMPMGNGPSSAPAFRASDPFASLTDPSSGATLAATPAMSTPPGASASPAAPRVAASDQFGSLVNLVSPGTAPSPALR